MNKQNLIKWAKDCITAVKESKFVKLSLVINYSILMIGIACGCVAALHPVLKVISGIALGYFAIVAIINVTIEIFVLIKDYDVLKKKNKN